MRSMCEGLVWQSFSGRGRGRNVVKAQTCWDPPIHTPMALHVRTATTVLLAVRAAWPPVALEREQLGHFLPRERAARSASQERSPPAAAHRRRSRPSPDAGPAAAGRPRRGRAADGPPDARKAKREASQIQPRCPHHGATKGRHPATCHRLPPPAWRRGRAWPPPCEGGRPSGRKHRCVTVGRHATVCKREGRDASQKDEKISAEGMTGASHDRHRHTTTMPYVWTMEYLGSVLGFACTRHEPT